MILWWITLESPTHPHSCRRGRSDRGSVRIARAVQLQRNQTSEDTGTLPSGPRLVVTAVTLSVYVELVGCDLCSSATWCSGTAMWSCMCCNEIVVLQCDCLYCCVTLVYCNVIVVLQHDCKCTATWLLMYVLDCQCTAMWLSNVLQWL